MAQSLVLQIQGRGYPIPYIMMSHLNPEPESHIHTYSLPKSVPSTSSGCRLQQKGRWQFQVTANHLPIVAGCQYMHNQPDRTSKPVLIHGLSEC